MSIFDKRLILVCGKGGVGRSTVAATIAMMCAKRGRTTLLYQTNANDRIGGYFHTQPVGTAVRELAPRLAAVNATPASALEEYGMMILKVRALYKAVMDNRLVKGFLRAVPGMDAWAMLGKALYHVKERDASGRPRYDLVILDAPATGHGLQMLRVPKSIVDVAPPGLLRREAEDGLRILQDPAQSGMVVVTLAEEMPTAETEELIPVLTRDLGLPLARLVINQVLPPLFANRLAEAEKAAAVLGRASALEPVAHAGAWRARREDLQRTMIERLAKLPGQKVILPALSVERMRRSEVQALAKGLGAL